MEAVGTAKGIASAMALTVLMALLVPLSAGAKFPPPDDAGGSPPGVTVTGLGFARGDAGASERAVRDARQRAAAITRVLGLQLGQVEAVDLPDLTQFGRGRTSGPTAAAATVTFAIVGGASGGREAKSVHASGAASARVRPRDRNRNRSIRHAILLARRGAAPPAATAARRSARVAAAAAGLELGTIVSVAEAASPYYYGPAFYDAALGSFGAGQFCGIVTRPVVRPDPETGVPRVVRRVPRRRCFVPSTYEVQLKIGYEAVG
jgi:hypothetical protein